MGMWPSAANKIENFVVQLCLADIIPQTSMLSKKYCLCDALQMQFVVGPVQASDEQDQVQF